MGKESDKKSQQELILVRERITDGALFVGTLLGVVAFGFSLTNFADSAFKAGFYIDMGILFVFAGLFLARNKVSLKFRVSGILLGILGFVYTDLYRNGVFADNNILMVLIPFFLLVVFSVRRTILIFLFSLSGYILFAILFLKGHLTPLSPLELRGEEPSTWIINIVLTTLLAAVAFVILNQYNQSFTRMLKRMSKKNRELEGYRDHLKEKVREKTCDLEAANEELKTTVTHLKETQSQLIESEKMASLGVLTAGVAHEINNPLNFIMGGYAGIERHLELSGELKEDENLQFYLDSIHTGMTRVNEIVRGLNQYSRQTETFTEECDLHKILDNNLSMVNNQLKYKVIVDKQYSSEDVSTHGNVGKLHQAFLNILVNASQAIEKEGRITLRTRRFSDVLTIEISDTGVGIEKEDLARITDPFFTTKEPGAGTGLGLAITAGIIREHRGKLAIESTPGKGTTVRIYLPAA